MASPCRLCHKEIEEIDHILWRCKFFKWLWCWIKFLFMVNQDFWDRNQVVKIMKNWSPFVKEIGLSTLVNMMVVLWKRQNLINFKDSEPNPSKCITGRQRTSFVFRLNSPAEPPLGRCERFSASSPNLKKVPDISTRLVNRNNITKCTQQPTASRPTTRNNTTTLILNPLPYHGFTNHDPK